MGIFWIWRKQKCFLAIKIKLSDQSDTMSRLSGLKMNLRKSMCVIWMYSIKIVYLKRYIFSLRSGYALTTRQSGLFINFTHDLNEKY